MSLIGHTTFGSGPEKVIVLHGWFGDHSAFDAMHPALDGETFTYAFMDYRGYGLSKDIAGEYSMAEIGQDALALADHYGWQKFHVIGHSMGGMAAQWVAAHAPERVKSGVGVTPVPASGYPMEGDTWGLFFGAAENPKNRGAIIMFTTGNRHNAAWEKSMTEASLGNSTRAAFAAYLNAWSKSDFADKMVGLKTPFKLLVGEHDPALTAEIMRQTVLQWLPHAELEIMQNAGHYPMNEIPVNLATTWEKFMKAHS